MRRMKKVFIYMLLLMAASACSPEVKDQAGKNKTVSKRKTINELAQLLPMQLRDYHQLSSPQGKEMLMENVTFSFIAQKYVNGKDTIFVELHDYFEDADAYSQYAKMWWDSNDPVNNEMKVSRYSSFGNGIDVWEVWERDDNNHSAVYVGIRNRYYMIFECFNQKNCDLIKNIAETFDYSKL